MNKRICVHGAGFIGFSCVEIIAGRNHFIFDYRKPLKQHAIICEKKLFGGKK